MRCSSTLKSASAAVRMAAISVSSLARRPSISAEARAGVGAGLASLFNSLLNLSGAGSKAVGKHLAARPRPRRAARIAKLITRKIQYTASFESPVLAATALTTGEYLNCAFSSSSSCRGGLTFAGLHGSLAVVPPLDGGAGLGGLRWRLQPAGPGDWTGPTERAGGQAAGRQREYRCGMFRHYRPPTTAAGPEPAD